MTGQLNDHKIMQIKNYTLHEHSNQLYMCEDSVGETLFQISMFITHCQNHCYDILCPHAYTILYRLHTHVGMDCSRRCCSTQLVIGEDKV